VRAKPSKLSKSLPSLKDFDKTLEFLNFEMG